MLPGDLIGRSPVAALCLADPRVSEVHAYVSLRGADLVLFGLRGRLGLDGEVVTELRLAPGQRLQLARDLFVTVDEVQIPHHTLAIEGPSLARHLLHGTCSLLLDPLPSVRPGVLREAVLCLYQHDGQWLARDAHGQTSPVRPGTQWQLGAHPVVAVLAPTAAAATHPTRQAGQLDSPLLVRALYDSVHIEREGRVVLSLSGRIAQLVSELVAFGKPVPWETLAGEIWGSDDPVQLRARLDITLNRLRKKLVAAGLRRDLVRPNGSGQIELFLGPDDQVEALL